jgi:hypothetical protein
MSSDSCPQLDQFNQLVSKASEMLSCGADCQKQKQAEELEQKYLNLANCSSAQAQEAQRNYIIFTQGQGAYNQMQDNKLQTQSQLIIQQFTQNFNNEVAAIQSQINTYSGILVNFRNVVDLYIQYKEENDELFKELKHETNEVLINERKTYYADQNIDGLKFYYFYFLLTIYVICVICFAVFSLIYPTYVSWKVRLAAFIGFIVLPFVSSWILATFIYLLYSLYNLLPKNIYAQKNY